MRNTLIMATAALFALCACRQEQIPETPVVPSVNTEIVFDLQALHPDPSTRAVKTGWEPGDVVFVFFTGKAAPAYLELKWDGSRWDSTPQNGLDMADGEQGSMRAVYLPFGSDVSVSAEGTSFVFSRIDYTYYLTAELPYAVENGKLSGVLPMRIPEGYVQFFMDRETPLSRGGVQLREPNLTPSGLASVGADGTLETASLAHGAPLPGYYYDKTDKEPGEQKGYLFSGILSVSARNVAADYHFTYVENEGWSGKYYYKEFRQKTFYRGETDGRAIRLPVSGKWTDISALRPFDLGIDVDGRRVYWSWRNLGADQDYESGDFYAWGETEPYYTSLSPLTWAAGKENGYSKSSYKYYDGSKFTKYIETDGAILQDEDDAAHVRLGGLWRMPTKEECMALVDGCTLNWQDNYRNSQGGFTGVSGFRFISKADSYKWMFIPALGDIIGTSRHKGAGTAQDPAMASYWTASDVKGSGAVHKAYSFGFQKTFQNSESRLWTNYNDDRVYGFCVRPVTY